MLLKLVAKIKFHTLYISLSDFLCLYYSEFMHNFIKVEWYHAIEAIL